TDCVSKRDRLSPTGTDLTILIFKRGRGSARPKSAKGALISCLTFRCGTDEFANDYQENTMPRPAMKKISRKLFVALAVCLMATFSICLVAVTTAGPRTAESRASATTFSCAQPPAGQVAFYTADATPEDGQG